MCVVILKPKNIVISKDTLNKCWQANQHGGGFAFAHNGKIALFKSLDKKDFMKKLLSSMSRFPQENFIIHFRIRTSGNISMANIHPFVINKNNVFAHNGHISGFPNHAKISDTRFFQKAILSEMKLDIENKAQMSLISMAIGQNNLMAFLNSSGKYSLANEESGTWESGSWFSNMFWQPYKSYYYKDKEEAHEFEYAEMLELNELNDCNFSEEQLQQAKEKEEELKEWKGKTLEQFQDKMKGGI